jgi:hypothetical protein
VQRKIVDLLVLIVSILDMEPYFAQPDNFLDDGPGSFGTITSLSIPMHQVQFGLKYRF